MDNNIGKRIQRVRIQHRMTANGLSITAGLAKSHVALIESGHVKQPKIDTLMSLARVLDVNFEWLATGKGAKFR